MPETLLALGFLEKRVLERGSDEHVFPELRGQDNFGDRLGKQFVRYRKNLGIYERLLDLHAFRHTASTHLIRAGVPQAHAEAITGHRSDARRTAFAIYDKGATLSLLKSAIDKLELPLAEAIRAAMNSNDDYAAGGDLITPLPRWPPREVPI